MQDFISADQARQNTKAYNSQYEGVVNKIAISIEANSKHGHSAVSMIFLKQVASEAELSKALETVRTKGFKTQVISQPNCNDSTHIKVSW